MSIAQRLRRLEELCAARPCAVCAQVKPVVAVWHGDPLPPGHCPRCGRALEQVIVLDDGIDTSPRIGGYDAGGAAVNAAPRVSA
jgi:hypothetical protein